ncbi:GGDEF domain-containing protein [Martelella mediterranea]|uniref:GGDEF domain-containing protein n=1 Tax=Martelella mediterranea TaxID=293089 RepID=UPI001E3E3005|nr:GGDEF domain-containing protein [Martelella mediterranea]MCD1636943.1 GGDEF domain-containing protein [Martelella mediterranea]
MQSLIVTGGLAILAASFVLAWFTGGRPRYLMLFALALLLVDVAFIGMFLRPLLPDDIALPFSNMAFIATQIIFGESLLQRRGKSFGRTFIITAFVLLSAVYVTLYFTSTIEIRTAGINVGLIVVFAVTLKHIWIRRDDTIHDKLIFWTFITLGLMHSIRTAGVFFNQDIANPQSVFWGFLQLYILLLAMILTLEILASHFLERLETANTLRDRDHLTGVLNRAGFERAVGAIYAGRTRVMVSLVLIDIDEFKAINDALGHPVGDAVLRRVGAVLIDQSRADDIVGRIGGDEFAILAVDLGAEGAGALGERIRRRLDEDAASGQDRQLAARCSVGAATINIERGYETLYAAADAALYEAKRLGRNRVVSGSSIVGEDRVAGNADVVSFPSDRRRTDT